MTEGWRKLHNEELHNLDFSPSIIRMIKSRRMRWAGHVACLKRNACRILVENTEGKSALGRHRRRWNNNINLSHGKIGWDGMDLIYLTQYRDQWKVLVKTVMNLRVP
jgi:hypothetical protein